MIPIRVLQSQTKQLMDQIKATRDLAEEITDDLKHKMVQHAQLIGEFEKNNRCISRLVLKVEIELNLLNVFLFVCSCNAAETPTPHAYWKSLAILRSRKLTSTKSFVTHENCRRKSTR